MGQEGSYLGRYARQEKDITQGDSMYRRERKFVRTTQNVGGTKFDQGLNPDQRARFQLDMQSVGRSSRGGKNLYSRERQPKNFVVSRRGQ